MRITACERCGGRGYLIDSPCKECRGRGAVAKTRKIRIMIPAGVEDGQTLRLRGEGNAGDRGVPPGDLYVLVNIAPHKIFSRRENDIYLETKIGVAQAMLGTELTVPTLYGNVKLEIPHGTQPGSVFKVKGKGLQRSGGWGKGDEYVRVNVEIPKNLSDQQKDLMKKFGQG